ncbi:MAG: hypothetical protein RLZZ28_2516 [Bacteroidota bacterium]
MKTVNPKDTSEKTTQASAPEQVDAFLEKLNHPKLRELKALREIIVQSHKAVGETIAWNAPAFFYTGKMAPFKPKEYKRYLLVSNYYRKDCIRLIFLKAASVSDPAGLLEGNYADGRRMAVFHSLEEINTARKELCKIVVQLIKQIIQSEKI